MLILKPHIFNEFPELICHFSTRSVWDYDPPYYFNLSLSVDDNREKVLKNREKFFSTIGMSVERAVFQKQVHSDKITRITEPDNIGESDGMVTDKKGIALCISTADCTAVFLYDKRQKIIAAVHSGWRGTHKKITEKTIKKLKTEFNCNAEDLFAYLGPSVSQVNYEVGREVAQLFDSRYLIRDRDRFLLDVSSANYDMLIREDIPSNQIQKSSLCSFEYGELFHSYRRDGKLSGRALGIIAMRDSV